MNTTGTHVLHSATTYQDELTPTRLARMRKLQRRLWWQRRLTSLAHSAVLPGALLMAVAASVAIPLPARAAYLGSSWSERISIGAVTVPTSNTIPWQQYAGTRIAFKGTLVPSIGRTTVTIVVQRGGTHITVGTMIAQAKRVFNTQLVILPNLFSTMGIAAQPNTSYQISVHSGSQTLTSATLTLAR